MELPSCRRDWSSDRPVKSPDNFNRYFAEQHMDSVMIPVDIVPDAVAAYLNAPARLAEHDRRAGDGAA